MAEGAAASSHVASSHISSQLRQRMLNRAATFSEGASPMQPLDRRRSSILSDLSDSHHIPFRPGGNDMEKLTSSEEPSFWHSLPLAFAILPAVGGLLFQNGSAVVTDVLLLAFGSMFLNWCVRAPWEWYHAAQQVAYVETDEHDPDDINPNDDDEGTGTREEDGDTITEPTSPKTPLEENIINTPAQTEAMRSAGRVLAREEILALIACFVGPILGAYILHALRSQLTRPAEGLVSNYNLTIFILAAELRPVSHIIKMKQAHLVHLQRIVRPHNANRLEAEEVRELSQRLADVEARLTEPVAGNHVEINKLSATIHQSLQPQLDALNRAVRRYEKRQVAQTIQIEARFGELETRLHDALALAAAAARTGRRPGLASMALTWIFNFAAFVIQTGWATLTYPYKVAVSIAAELKAFIVKPIHQPRKRTKGQANGQVSTAASRTTFKNGKCT